MNEQIIYPALLITAGVLLSTVVIIILIRVSNKIIRFFELYPESKGIINFSLKFISWFLGLIILLIFIRLALKFLGLEFTTQIAEDAITLAPKCILAALVILIGGYIAKSIRSRSKEYQFEFKDTILLIMDFIVYMTFVFTALYTIGVNITFFQEFYTVVLWVIGGIIVLIVSIIVGIPLGMSIYKKTKKRKNTKIPKK